MNRSINTRRIALAALFTAASLILSFIQIPIFPAAPYLMYDPSGIVCLLAAMAFGPSLGAGVAVISWLPRVFLDPFGTIMGIISTLCFILPASILYQKSGQKRSASLAGMVLGAVLSIAASCLMNLIITPLYAPGTTVAQVAAMIVPILIPFNLLKMVIHTAAGQLLLAPCVNVIESAHAGANSTSSSARA